MIPTISRRKRFVVVKSEPIPELPLNFKVHVDRSVRPNYPDWVKPESINSLEFVALEKTGPSDFNLGINIEKWLHDVQKNDRVSGYTIYRCLKKDNMLELCLGLADLRAIQTKGITVFRNLFLGMGVFGWKSIVPHDCGERRVPYLIEDDGLVVECWRYLDYDWRFNNPALLFRK